MKKLVLFLLLATMLCSPGLVGFAAEASYEEYMSKERSLSDISPTDYSKQWVGDPFVMRDGLLSGYQKKYPDASLVVGNAYQERIVDGKTQLVCVAEGNFGNYNSSGRYTYLSTGGTILQLDLTTLKSVAIYTGNDSIDQLWVFEDIIYFSSAGSIYRYYAPDGSSELLYTTDTALKGIRPLSNYIIMLVEDNPDYWEAVAASGVKEGELLKDREAFSKWMNEKFGLQTSPESKPFLYCDVQNILMVCGISSAKSSWYNTKTKEWYNSPEEVNAASSIAYAEEIDESLPKELLKQIPISAHSGKEENIQTVAWGNNTNHGVSHIIFDELFRMGLLPKDMAEFPNAPTGEELAACPKVSVEDVNKVFDRLFGPSASARLSSGQVGIGTGNKRLQLSEDKKNYIYIPYSYSGSAGNLWRMVPVRSEAVGNDIVVYAKFGYHFGESQVALCENFGSYEELHFLSPIVGTALFKDEQRPFVRMHNGDFDEYLPVYRHTFKPNGDGTYYWAQTELETAGKEIPLSVIKPAKEDNTNTSTQGSTNTNTTTDTTRDVTTSEVVSDTSTDTATDVSTNTTDAITDVSTGSATDVVPQEESSSAVWIVVAVVAVAAVAAAAVFFVLKKKKA